MWLASNKSSPEEMKSQVTDVYVSQSVSELENCPFFIS